MIVERGPESHVYPILQGRLDHTAYNFVSSHIARISQPNSVEHVQAQPHQKCAIISGPPGGGKDTLVEMLMSLSPAFERPRTVTTRAQRVSEKIADPYIRMTEEQFLAAREAGEFMETDFHGYWYGSPKSEVMRVLEMQKTPILRIDPNGANSILDLAKQRCAPFENVVPVYAYIVPPRGMEIYTRLMKRTLEEPDMTLEKAQAKTLARIEEFVIPDLAHMSEAHFVLINEEDKLEIVAREFLQILGIENQNEASASA